MTGPLAYLRLSRAIFPVEVLGPGRRAVIWTQGCTIHCPGCVALDTWSARDGQHRSVASLLGWLSSLLPEGLDGVTISGGEPTEQPTALAALLTGIRCDPELNVLDVLVFSGREPDWVIGEGRGILSGADAVMAGPYVETQAGYAPLRGSDNQVLIVLTDRGAARFGDESQLGDRRRLEIDVEDGELHFVGIPTPDALAGLVRQTEEHGLVLKGRSWRR